MRAMLSPMLSTRHSAAHMALARHTAAIQAQPRLPLPEQT